MPESDAFWDFFWEMRLRDMETLGKREAILAGSRLITRLEASGIPARMLELGCGEGQIIGALAEAHAQVHGVPDSVGVDYLPTSLETARRDYRSVRFIEGDFTDRALLASLGLFQIVLLVNALHEVFSAAFSPALGEVDPSEGKRRAASALAGAVDCIAPGGYLLLFDGLEPPGDPAQMLRVRFLDRQAHDHFETFAREYRPFHITYRPAGPLRVELPRRDFTRYITKSIFLGKRLWQTEQRESYQYFQESEFRAAIGGLGLQIRDLRTLTVNEEKWSRFVEIETPGETFPVEHILIVAEKGIK